MSPLTEYEWARDALAGAKARRYASPMMLAVARRYYRRAVVRLIVASAAWLALASVAAVIVWALAVTIAACAPQPLDVQHLTL